MTTALVHVPGCPECGADQAELVVYAWIEDALLRGGGYGASRVHRVATCTGCHWEIEFEVSEIRPLRRRVLVGQR